MKDERVYLHHIHDAIEQIKSYVAGLNKEAFFDKRMVQGAVVRQLEIVGEASRNLPVEFRASHHQIPWHAIIGMRNRFVHEYVNIDLDVIWEVIKVDLPPLKEQIDRLLA